MSESYGRTASSKLAFDSVWIVTFSPTFSTAAVELEAAMLTVASAGSILSDASELAVKPAGFPSGLKVVMFDSSAPWCPKNSLNCSLDNDIGSD